MNGREELIAAALAKIVSLQHGFELMKSKILTHKEGVGPDQIDRTSEQMADYQRDMNELRALVDQLRR